MPEYGNLDLATHPDRLEPAPSAERGAWDLAGATVISVAFEVTTPRMIDLLPRELIRPVPAYARLLIIDAPDSPAGPYREASLFLGAREGLVIRNFLVDSVIEGGAQLEAAREAFGGSRRAGTVALTRAGDGLAVEIGDSGGRLASVHLRALRPCDPTMLKFDALMVAGTGAGQPCLLRYGARIDTAQVDGAISKDWYVTMERRDSPWWRLRPAYNITAFTTTGPVRLEAAQAPARTA